ncbi:MAG: SDR family NAD(P)-dependent oxidoreductase [Deltaproteobacteria bacterium]|nr:SDR family NAD(P)-dependent oxidoreductase [Deltaproteobacteria bacterium]
MTSLLQRKYGPWALVTGAARGLGAEFAEQIAAAGLNLVLVDVDEPGLQEQCESLGRRHSVDVLGFMPAMTDTPALRAESPNARESMIMSVEGTVKLALDSLGRTPSIFAGTLNRVVHRVLRSVLPRSTLIRLGSRAIRSMSRS